MITAVTGGKGGTGKTSVALSLALSRGKKITYIDADVETPDAALLLGADMFPIRKIKRWVPVAEDGCRGCGRCAEECPLHAVVCIPGKTPVFFHDKCIGCKLCREACPAGAIEGKEIEVGTVRKGVFENKVVLYDCPVNPRVEETGSVVRKFLDTVLADVRGDVIIDTAAGIHCNVVRALIPSDRVVVVTEPTPYGVHDLKKVIKLVKILGKPFEIFGNKWGLSERYQKIIEEIAERNGVALVKIPYSEGFAQRYARGEFVPLEVDV